MSVILITEHNENIYNSTKMSTTYHKKLPMYVSKFRADVKRVVGAVKKMPHGTMGLPRHPPPNPSDFIRKHTKHASKPPEERRCLKSEKRPPVPTKTAMLQEEKDKKKKAHTNFVAKNVKYVLNMKSKEPEQKVVIDRFGVAKKLSAGLEPRYIYSSTFGKTPPYLAEYMKTEVRNMQIKKDTSGIEQPKCRYITKDERDSLLAGLKENWEELQKLYQGLPILTDTIPKIHRKSKMEAQLKQLEKDIVLLERHPYIYVYKDNELS